MPCLVGIATAEFKYDTTDGLYRLMEVNLRNLMSGGLGRCSGVDLAAAQYLDAVGEAVPKQTQVTDRGIHYVYCGRRSPTCAGDEATERPLPMFSSAPMKHG